MEQPESRQITEHAIGVKWGLYWHMLPKLLDGMGYSTDDCSEAEVGHEKRFKRRGGQVSAFLRDDREKAGCIDRLVACSCPLIDPRIQTRDFRLPQLSISRKFPVLPTLRRVIWLKMGTNPCVRVLQYTLWEVAFSTKTGHDPCVISLYQYVCTNPQLSRSSTVLNPSNT